jgi:CO/xanthine dehydrogenase Mo-binding subunit
VGTPSQPFRIIGRRAPTVEALEKVTGRAPLGGHVPLPCLLVSTVRRSPSAHARLQHIDTDKATVLSGERPPSAAELCPHRSPPSQGPPVAFP